MPGLPRSGEFHPGCPYYQGETKAGGHPPLCRLREEFEDGRVFIGDSFGDNVWIDATEPRNCPPTCLCRSLDPDHISQAAEKDVFAFKIMKKSGNFQIQIHSEVLHCQVLDTAFPLALLTKEPLVNGAGAFNGHILRTFRAPLVARLRELEDGARRRKSVNGYNASCVKAELSLLVQCILSCGVMSPSFGLQDPHEQIRTQTEDWVDIQGADVVKWSYLAEQISNLLSIDEFNIPRGKEYDHELELDGRSLKDTGAWGQANFEVESLVALKDLEEALAESRPQRAHHAWKPERYAVTTDNQVLREHKELRESRLRLQRQDLLSKYESPETSLLKTVRDGDALAVRALLQHAKSVSHVGPSVPAEVLDLDGVLEGTTALIEAVRGDHLRIAKMLIQHGADINTMTPPRETALTVAAKAGSEAILRLLLAYGADPHVAVLILRIDVSAGSGASAINRLTASVASYRNNRLLNTRKVRNEVMRLRREFHDEHCRMLKVADTHAYSQWLSMRPSEPLEHRFGLEGESRKAWCIALRTLRGFCNGVLPSDLNETLLFIALSRVMSSIVHGKDDAGAAAELNQDLGRWQLLFNPEGGGLHAFQEAVWVLWRVDPFTLKPTPHANKDMLAAFQDMALSCFSRAGELYQTEGLDEFGLVATQNRWRERQQGEPPKPDAGDPGVSCRTEKESQSGDDGVCVQEAAAEKVEFDILLDPPKPPPPLDPEPTPIQGLFVILVAGAIFAAVIAFLLLIREGPVPHAALGAVSAMSTAAEESMPSGSLPAHNSAEPGTSQRGTPGRARSPVKHIFKSRPTSPTGQRAQGTLRDLLAARCSEDERLERTERTYYLLAAYFGLPPCKSIPAMTRKRKRAPPVEPGAPGRGALGSGSGPALPPPPRGPAPEAGRQPKTQKTTFCTECRKEFHTTSNYGRHRAGPEHDGVRHHCSFPGCRKSYNRNDVRKRHERRKHGKAGSTGRRLFREMGFASEQSTCPEEGEGPIPRGWAGGIGSSISLAAGKLS